MAKLHQSEVTELNIAPRARFYSGERARRDYGPQATAEGAPCAYIMAGFHGDQTARVRRTRAGTPLITVLYSLEPTGNRRTESGNFLDFRVVNGDGDGEPTKWLDSKRPSYESAKTSELDDLRGMSGCGIWQMAKAVNRDGECPLYLIGIAFQQRSVRAASMQRHVTALGVEVLIEMLEVLPRR